MKKWDLMSFPKVAAGVVIVICIASIVYFVDKYNFGAAIFAAIGLAIAIYFFRNS